MRRRCRRTVLIGVNLRGRQVPAAGAAKIRECRPLALIPEEAVDRDPLLLRPSLTWGMWSSDSRRPTTSSTSRYRDGRDRRVRVRPPVWLL
jgi:hypothetical protein